MLNLGIEGIMVVGAFTGWLAVYAGLPLWAGVAAALLTGMAFGLLHGVLTVPLGLSQHVVGLGITLLATASRLLRLPPRAARASPRRRASSPSRPLPAPRRPRPDAAHLPRLR